MKKILALVLILALSISLFGCSSNEANNQAGEQAETEKFKASMTFNGSSTLAPVVSAIATDFIEDNKTWDKVGSFPENDIAIYVSSGGSSSGIKAVIEDTSDFGMVAREVKDEEKEKIENCNEFKLGMDALTISVNPENPLCSLKDDLTSEEIKKIFSGEIKYWDELDSSLPHNEIVVVIRDLGGGAHEVFQKSIMGDTEVRADAIQAPSMGALVTKVIENKDTIGYASYGMVNQNKGKLVPFKVDGIEPTAENIVNGSYKIARPLLVVKKGELTPQEQVFMDYVFSEEGTAIIEKMGFVPTK